MRRLLCLLCLALASGALAQSNASPVPQNHIPPTVLMELRALESQFDLALARDCAPERCFSKGCTYRDHVVVDQPRGTSLPGLGHAEGGPGAVPSQEYLTQARCEFAHEKAVPIKDVQALVRRLEQRLSKGWLQVTVGRQILEPIAPGLSESPPPEPPPAKVEPTAPPASPLPPAKWEAAVAVRELWVSLLPHFSWMIAVVLGTLAFLLIIWALRRLGRESAEDKALLAQLSGAPGEAKAKEEAAATEAEAQAAAAKAKAEADAAALDGSDGKAFVSEQQQLWTARLAHAELAKDESVVVDLLKEWLKAGEFDLLAKAVLVFGDRLTLAFSSDGELAVRKVELAEYLRNVDEAKLPSDADFFRKLNQHAISSSLLSQADAEIYRSLREEFGTAGIVQLTENLDARHGALLFAMLPPETQAEVARSLTPELRMHVAHQLLMSNRISKEERTHIFEALNAARQGLPIPAAPEATAHDQVNRGRELNAAGALSVLLPHLDPADRKALFAQALERSGGAFPLWYEDILYPDMILKLPAELQADMLLEVDVRGLAGWSSVQNPAWQEHFINRLQPSMQNALRSGMRFGSRTDQLQQARRGHDELVAAVKRLVAQGKLNFSEIVA